MAPPFVVGIDLGTTNSALAYSLDGTSVETLPIVQWTSEGRRERPLLPSVLYAPLVDEGLSDPCGDAPWIAGELARVRAEETVGRSVTSAKSWLSHATLDPHEPTLPTGASAGAPRLSPVAASARFLVHLARSFAAHTRRSLKDAHVVLTLPASFDEAARAATLAAAEAAELRVILLEEPQAAFYEYAADEGTLARLLGKRERKVVLVVDVGGGTTDLSLVAIERSDAGLTCKRIATGEHLLLGGDNMDMALAALAKPSLGELDAFLMTQLTAQCRRAKELLLTEGAPTAAPVTLAERGRALVGRTRTTRLTRADVRAALLEGFFPATPGRPPVARRGALVRSGLAYERDPAITRHVTRFLDRFAGGHAPDAILLNGGVFRSKALRHALVDAVRRHTDAKVALLADRDPDLSVARGAVRYGLLRATGGRTIEAGAARSYYLGVADGNTTRGVCVVPRGTREGDELEAATPVLKLRTGELARFELYRARSAIAHRVGEVIDPTGKGFTRLRPLSVRATGASGFVDVTLRGRLTPVGTLALELAERSGQGRRHALEFHLRATAAESAAAPVPPAASSARTDARSAPSDRAKAAAALVAEAFSFAHKQSGRVKTVVDALERSLGPRLEWSLGDARALADALLSVKSARRWTADHERVFWTLLGIALRPGFGDAGDEARIAQVEPLHAQRAAFGDRPAVAQAYYVAWRRIAGGLDRDVQLSLWRGLAPSLPTRGRAAGATEARELMAWLERVPLAQKRELGDALSAELRGAPNARALADLSRVAARVPSYGEVSGVVPPAVVAAWLTPEAVADARPTTVDAVIRMARLTESARDLPLSLRRSLAKKLRALGATEDATAPLLHVVAPAASDARFGDALPPGLVLADTT